LDESKLEGLVSKDQLEAKGFRRKPQSEETIFKKKKKYMYRIHGDYEIRYVEVMPNAYILDGVGRIPPKLKKEEE